MPELRSLAATVAALLKEAGDTIAASESSCGGFVSACLVSIPGASAYYVGSAIVYTRIAQKELLHVPDTAMEGKRASTEAYALMNARAIREVLGTTWALSETGPAAPRVTSMATRRSFVLRGVWPGGEDVHPGNRGSRPRGEHVEIRQARL